MKNYSEPDKSEWDEGDPRQQLTAFDEDPFRKQYNEWMVREQSALDVIPELCCAEKYLVDAVKSVGGHALDIGCGNGRLLTTFKINRYIDSGVGIDISDIMIENARKTAQNNDVLLFFERRSLESMPYFGCYNIIIATEVLEHFFNVRLALKKISRYLVDDGVFVGVTPLEHNCDAVVHLHYFTLDNLTNLLHDYFSIVDVDVVDVTGVGENHLVFKCWKPIKDAYE